MGEQDQTTVLYKNDQWMVQKYKGGIFVVEVVNVKYDDLDRDDWNYEELFAERKRQELEGGYWIEASDLRRLINNHGMIAHVCEKTWVDIDAFEPAVLHAFLISGIRPEYDVAAQFAKARERKLRWASRSKAGPMTAGELVAEFLDDQEAI